MAREVLPGVKFFETLKEGMAAAEYDVDNPLSSAHLNYLQLEQLTSAYIELYNEDASFRFHVDEMLRIESDRETDLRSEKDYSALILKKAAERDEELVRRINKRWEESGFWPIQGVDPGPFRAFSAKGRVFFANGRVSATGRLGFLGDLDLEVPCAAGQITFKENNLDYHFCAALARFWPHFEQRLLGQRDRMIIPVRVKIDPCRTRPLP